MINILSVMISHVKVRRHLCLQGGGSEGQKIIYAGLALPTFFGKREGGGGGGGGCLSGVFVFNRRNTVKMFCFGIV